MTLPAPPNTPPRLRGPQGDASARSLALALQKKIARNLTQAGANLSGKRVLVLCSGGIDSTAAISLLATMPRGSRPRSIEVLFLDHSYRNNIYSERLSATKIAARYNLPFHTRKRLTGPSDAVTRGRQDQARQWRYKTAIEVAKETDCQILVTGHNASDQVETAIMGLIGVTSSSAMCVKTQWTDAAPYDLDLIRPLLCLSRGEIEEYAVSQDITWGEDPSNADPEAYVRNKIRHQVVPALLQINEDAGAAISKSAQREGSSSAALRSLAQALLQTILSSDSLKLDKPSLANLDMAAREQVVALWLMSLMPEPRSFNAKTVTAVASLCEKGAGSTVKISAGQITADKENLVANLDN